MAAERLYTAVVEDSWIDALGHVNFLEYQRIADIASERLWAAVGGPPLSNSSLSYVIVQTHVHYLRELRLGDPVCIDTHVIGFDVRRVHVYHSIRRQQELVSIVQILALAFDLSRRRAGRWTDPMLEALALRTANEAAGPLEGLIDWGLRGARSG